MVPVPTMFDRGHSMEPERKILPAGILNPAKFSRDRQVDLCAECHNGIQREALAPTFSYVPGRPLSEYFKQLPSPDVKHPDVHGNQVGLLQRSKCYRSSTQMSCTTCHDVHSRRQSAEFYSQKCLTCHQWQSCGLSETLGHKIVNQCVHCHMPRRDQRNRLPDGWSGCARDDAKPLDQGLSEHAPARTRRNPTESLMRRPHSPSNKGQGIRSPIETIIS